MIYHKEIVHLVSIESQYDPLVSSFVKSERHAEDMEKSEVRELSPYPTRCSSL